MLLRMESSPKRRKSSTTKLVKLKRTTYLTEVLIITMIIIIKKKTKRTTNDFESHPHQRFYTKTVKDKGLVVGRPISANPGLKFKPGFFFFYSKAFSRIIFPIPIIKLWTKRKKAELAFYVFISEFKFCTNPGLT